MASEREARIEAVCAAFHDAMLSLDHSWGLPDDLKMLGGEGEKHAAIRKVWLDAVALMRTAPSAAPASVGRAIEELECVLDYGVAEQLADYIQDRIAALRAEPSPEPQRAGAGLVEAVTELIGWLKRVFDGPAHRSAHINNQLGRQSIEPVIHALAAEQAREPDDRDEEVSALRGHVQHQRDRADLAVQRADALQTELRIEKVYAGEQRKRAEQAESALAALREQVEALVIRAKVWRDTCDNYDTPPENSPDIVRDLAALPTEPEGRAAKADAGGVAFSINGDHYPSELMGLSENDVLEGERQIREGDWISLDELRRELRGKAIQDGVAAWDNTLMDGLRAEPPFSLNIDSSDNPNRDVPPRPMPTETFSEDEPDREGDDVLPIGAPDSAKREALRRGLLPFLCCQGNDPDCYGPSGCLLRALEGR